MCSIISGFIISFIISSIIIRSIIISSIISSILSPALIFMGAVLEWHGRRIFMDAVFDRAGSPAVVQLGRDASFDVHGHGVGFGMDAESSWTQCWIGGVSFVGRGAKFGVHLLIYGQTLWSFCSGRVSVISAGRANKR
jgi:hypothetical protein